MKNELNSDSLVSVIVPIYNVEKYVAKCIESICKQSYTKIEIILVDDGSTDSSGVMADNYAKNDSRIVVVHKQGGGVSSARNKGIEVSTGDYICFVDGDDYVMPDYVEYMLGLAKKHNTGFVIVPEVFGTFNERQNENQEDIVVSVENALEMLLCYRIREGCYSKLFSREFLGDDLRFSEKLVMGEGFTFNSIAIQHADKVVLGYHKIYFYRRDNATSATTKFRKEKFENGLYALDVIRDNIQNKTEKVMKAWEYAYWRTHSDVYDAIVLAHAEKECNELYMKSKRVAYSNALIALKVPVKRQDKLRAIVMWICPRAIPWAMLQRRKKYHAEV